MRNTRPVYLILLLLTLFLFLFAYHADGQTGAQTGEADSLKQFLDETENDSLRLEAGMDLYVLSFIEDSTSAETKALWESAVKLAEEQEAEKQFAVALYGYTLDRASHRGLAAETISLSLKGMRYTDARKDTLRAVFFGIEAVNNLAVLGKFDDAVALAVSLEPNIKKTGNKDAMMNFHYAMGNINSQRGYAASALDHYLKCLRIIESNKKRNDLQYMGVVSNLGKVYDDQELYEKGRKYLRIGLDMAKKTDDKYFLAMNYLNAYRNYANSGMYDSAFLSVKKGIETSKKAGFRYMEAFGNFLIGQGFIEYGKGTTEEATPYLEKALRLFKDVRSDEFIARTKIALGACYFKTGQKSRGLKLIREGHKSGLKMEHPEILRFSSEELSRAYKKLGDFKESLRYHEDFKMYTDSIINKEQANKIAGTEMQYELEKKEAKQKLEDERKKAEFEASLAEERFRRNILLVLSLSILTVALLIYRSFRLKKKINTTLQEKNIQISDQKAEIEQQAEELKMSNRHLQDLGEFKKRMTSMIVHDLKNPLNIITNLSSSEKEVSEPERRRIYSSGRQMSDMVMNILDIQKFEEAKIELNEESFLVGSLLKNCIEDISILAEEKNIRLISSFPENIKVTADFDLLRRTLTNLLTNALRFSPAGEEVKLSAKIDNGEQICFSVKDKGPGIAADVQNKIFEYFSGNNPIDKSSVKPTGIGLTFCRMAVEAHGSILKFDSKVGEGADFYFSVKRSEVFSTTDENKVVYEPAHAYDKPFSNEERTFLINLLQKISEHEFFEATEIERIIRESRPPGTETQYICGMLRESVFSGNEQHFKDLINKLQSV